MSSFIELVAPMLIIPSALTLENLESNFYSQGFQKFPDSEFMAAGLTNTSITSLKQVASQEATHVVALSAAIKAAGQTPVQNCTYNFNYTTAANMLATAKVLEAVGVSAYLGAAPLLNSSAVLGTAATIATVEAVSLLLLSLNSRSKLRLSKRHQAIIRVASGITPSPQPFDNPLGPRSVFTLAGAFIQSCPTGSNLQIQPFPAIAVQNGMNVQAGTELKLSDPQQPAGATNCAFTAGGVMGGSLFVPLTNGACAVPSGLNGEVYMTLTKTAGPLSDDIVLAG
jgi:Ferritin-like domain